MRGLVPNYQYADLGVGYQQMQAIRGISVFSENPSIATYIDGVNALDVSANGMQLIDIERIEVLRGPQGTLYGRNAMGGVLNIITKQPTAKPGGFVEVSLGNQGLQRYAVGLKIPLVKDKLFAGVSGQYQKQFGFYFNDLSDKMSFDGVPLKGTAEDGQRMGDEESFYGNIFLKWLPSSKWKIVLNVKAQRDQSTGASMYYQAVENEAVAVKNPYKMAVNSLGSNSRSIVNTSLAANYYHSKFSFVSVSAYQYILQAYKNIDQDLFPYDLATGATYDKNVGDPMPQRVVSQEFRFSSAPSAKRVTWTAGTYLFYQQYNKRYAATYEKLALLFGERPGTKVSQTDDENSGAAVFGEATYHLKKKWEFTIGLRYDFESRSTLVGKFDIDSANHKTYTVPLNKRSKSFHALSPKAVVSYKLNANHHLYISYSRGFRAGGINTSSKVSGYETYKPEYSDNAELGYKFNSANNQYSLQSSFFYLYWHDLQLDLRTDGGVYVINNIGNVQSLGFEIEATAKPVKNLLADVSIGYNHSRYQNFNFLGQNIKGNKTIMAPAVTLFTGLQYLAELPKQFGILVRGECRYMGEQYFDLINSIKQPGYALLNARVELKYKSVGLSLWIQNIANKKYIAYAMPGYFRYTILNRPRQYGATLNLNF